MASNQEEQVKTPIRTVDWREPPVAFNSEESIMQSGEGMTRSASTGRVDEQGQGNQLNLILNMMREEKKQGFEAIHGKIFEMDHRLDRKIFEMDHENEIKFVKTR
ncbi:hypothetical protein QE152_g19262 [Popillia japonica]|uniref:Uncharacterized protein n=1 Tax=Popillia japonica TaxID=7064 RepID=A0AAW1KV14_POPJA